MKIIGLIFTYLSLAACMNTAGTVYSRDYAYDGGPYVRQMQEEYRKTIPTEDEKKAVKYARKPKDFVSLFKKTITESLKDSDSAKIKNIQSPKKMWLKNEAIIGIWVICGEVNAKNSYGAYTGFSKMGVAVYSDNSSSIITIDELGAEFKHVQYETPCGE